MNLSISSIWERSTPEFVTDKLQDILHESSNSGASLQVFFRADDIAFIDERFSRMMDTFLSYEAPLCLAVVPDWLDQEGWEAMQEFEPQSPLWCWHQHGRTHSNHEPRGKKCEFGDSRSREDISRDLIQGRESLVSVMGDLFFPVFTPPWNRCGLTTLNLLHEFNYLAVSRSKGSKPSSEGILPDIAVNIDLHTRKEKSYEEGWNKLLNEFAIAANDGRMGIMLHHQRMNEHAFTFLELLLTELRLCKHVSCCTFKDLLQNSA